jgi:hypothetical protein
MCKGSPTSFLVATGCKVTINTILGLLFIQQTKMVIDAADQVAKLCALNVPPFPIDFCCSMCAVPPVNKACAAKNAAMHAEIVCEIESNQIPQHQQQQQQHQRRKHGVHWFSN